MFIRRLTCALLPLVAACNLDLSVPDTPQVGGVKGVLDISGHDELVATAIVSLVDDNGSKTQQPLGADGSFNYDGIKPGSYYLKIDLPKDVAPSITVPGIRVRAGLVFDVGTITPEYPQIDTVVSGTVTVSGGGNPAGGEVDFLVEPTLTKRAVAIIALDGTFISPPVKQGTYTLRAKHPLYVTAEITHIGVSGPSLTLSMPISMDVNPATLTGTVTEEAELPDGGTSQPAVGASITLSGGATTTTDVAGNFVLTGLPAGDQMVRVTQAHYTDTVASHAVTLAPAAMTPLEPVKLVLLRSTITGTISTADNQPATDITVAVNGTSHGSVAVPDPANPAQAKFEITNVPDGVYDLRATKAHYTPAVRSAVTINGQNVNSDTGNPPLVLTIASGDFVIDDGDASNTAGYTRTPTVTLQFALPSGVAQLRASEDSAFGGVAYAPFTGTTLPFTLGSSEGTHTVYAQYKDGSGVQSQVLSASIVLDTTPPSMPSLIINSGLPFTKTANPLFLTLQASDALSGVAKVRLNENGMTTGGLLNLGSLASYQRDMAFTRSTSADGPATVYAQFIDNAGNASLAVSASITIDTVPPSGSLAIADGTLATVSAFTNSPLVTLSEMAMPEPNGGSVLIKLANSQASLNTAVYVPVSASSAWFLDPSSDGLKTVYAVLQDAAGNTSGTFSASITYDSTAPSPATATLASPAVTSDAGIVLSLSAMDNFGLSPTKAVTVSEDPFFQSGALGPMAFPGNNKVSFTLSPQDGPKQVYVRYRDGAGNDTRASVQVLLDTTPPTGSFTLVGTLADGTTSSTVTSTAAVTAAIVQSGASAYFLVDEANTGMPAACPASGYQMLTASNVPLTLSAAGSRRVRLCLQDAAGNTLGPLTQVISYDGTSPSGCALSLTGRKVDGSAAPAGKTATASVTGSVTGCTETPTDLFITSNAVVCSAMASFPWQAYSASLAVLLPGPDGANTVRGCVRDAAHNVGSLTAGTLTLDTLPPQSPQVVLDSGAQFVNGATAAMRGGNIAGATGTAVGATLWALSSSPTPGSFVAFTSPTTSNVTFSAGDGTKTVYAYFQDDVGNTTVAVTDDITFDTTAPSTSAASVTLNPGGNGFTRFRPVTVQVAAPSDATQMLIVNAAAAACAQGDFAAAMPQPFSPLVNGFNLTDLDGTRRVCVELLDAAGNPSAIVSNTIVLDRVAPAGCAVSLTGHKVDGSAAPAGKTASASVTASVSGCGETPTDIVLSTASLSCMTGGVLSFSPYAASLPFLLAGPDGTNSAYACVRDAAGNVSAATTGTITLDTLPPQSPSVVLDTGAQYVNAATAAMRGGNIAIATGTAVGATLWATSSTATPGSFVAFTSPATASVTLSAGDGPKTVYAYFQDDVGNTTVAVTDDITFDTAPPSIVNATVTVNPGGNGYTRLTNVSLQLAAPSDATQMRIANAAGASCVVTDFTGVPLQAFSAFVSSFGLNGVDGVKRVCVELDDAAGNPSSYISGTITLDRAPPAGCTLSLVGHKVDGSAAPAGKTASQNVTLGVAGCGETPTSIVLATSALTCVTGNSYSWIPYAATLPFSLSGPDGTNSAFACVTDAAGNVGTATSANITLDTQPPTAPSVTIDTGALYVNLATFQSRGSAYKADVQGSAIGAADWVIYENVPGAFTSFPPPSPNLYTFTASEGLHTIRAVFRDDVGNATGVVSASITFDTQVPVPGALTLKPGGNGYTNSVSVPAQLNNASGATQMQVGPAAGPNCQPSDLASVPKTPFTALPFNVLLASGDGSKKECVMLWDDAQNASAIISASITLDTTPPTVPAILNQTAIVNRPDNSLYTMNTGGSVFDTNFFRFEKLGGKLTAWTPDSTDATTTTFSYNLVSDPSQANGLPNVLRLRAVDLAGNTAESSVVITTDISPPTVVTLNTLWVSNGDRTATVYWKPSTSTDVVGYNVYYGSASGVYTGQYADNGPSPVFVSTGSRATLSGLINASPTYVTVKPVDHAGNEGPTPFGPNEVGLQPNKVSPDYMGSVTMASYPHVLAHSDSTLYVLEDWGDPNISTGGIALQAIDLSGLTSPIQDGVPQVPTPPMPTPTMALTYNDGISSFYVSSLMDMQLDGQYLFTADATKVRIFDVSVPLSPTLIDTIDTLFPAQSIQVRGTTLFVSGTPENSCGTGGAMAIDLGPLYDQNANTRPTLCGGSYPACVAPNVNNLIGARVTTGMCSGNQENALLATRNQVISFEVLSTTWNASTIYSRAAPSFVLQGPQSDFNAGVYTYAVTDGVTSGNLAFLPTSSQLLVVNLKNVWSGQGWGDQVPLLKAGITGGYQTELVGAQMFLSDGAGQGFRALDFGTFLPGATMTDNGLAHTPYYSAQIAQYGNYLAVVDSNMIDFFEAATPRSVHAVTSASLRGQGHKVVGGFLYSQAGALDLLSGATTVYGNLNYPVSSCTWAQTYMDDYELTAGGPNVHVLNFDNAIDRDVATAFDGTQFYTVPMAANVLASGIATMGNYVVLAERRLSGTTGVYLEVLDGRKIRDHVAATTLCNSTTPCPDSLASYFVTANMPASNRADLTLYNGRAFIAIDGTPTGIYIVDLRPAFDDSASALTASSYQGMATVAGGNTNPHGVIVQGHYLYFATDSDIEIVDVANAMDESSATTVTGAAARASIPVGGVVSLDVRGSYLVAASAYAGVVVYDVSKPLTPVALSSAPYQTSGASCFIDGNWATVQAGLSVHGTRAYVTSVNGTNIFELE